MILSNITSYIYNNTVKKYCLNVPFDPPEAYPELPNPANIDTTNQVYPMVRELLVKLGLDKENVNTPKWNPFKDIIKPGNNVLIKPNLVSNQHYLGNEALYSTITHGSILRPIIDYVYIALNDKGSIVIADNPIEMADFDALMNLTKIKDLVKSLTERGYPDLKVFDLRPRLCKEDKKGRFYYENQTGDPLGYTNIDLGSNSLFAEFDLDRDIHYYTLADQTIDHLNPKCVRQSLTDKYHNSSRHSYIVSKTVLDSDVIINFAKLKSHCKAGVSLTLKNMIGMVYQKECMPHHRPGLPPKGDSFPHYPASYYVASRKLYRSLRKWCYIHRAPGFRTFKNLLRKNKILIDQHTEHGNWKGNDTIWRTILDLNRIAIYSDKQGKMQDSHQRKIIAFIDGIISQQGEGPMAGNPVKTSILFGGFNPVLVDALAVKTMGLDYRLFKSLSKAHSIKKWEILNNSECDLTFKDMDLPNFNFELPKGWR